MLHPRVASKGMGDRCGHGVTGSSPAHGTIFFSDPHRHLGANQQVVPQLTEALPKCVAAFDVALLVFRDNIKTDFFLTTAHNTFPIRAYNR